MRTPLALLSALLLAGARAAQSLPDPERFSIEVLAEGMPRPQELAVARDGRVLWTELDGRLMLLERGAGAARPVLELPVFADQENGLLGLALDPDFERTGWLYAMYSPRDFSGQRIARFTLQDARVDPASERVLFAWSEQREECCHHAGSLAFGPDGCLYASTGDNTHPHGDSEGYAPLDNRAGRSAWNALRTSANPRSANGKVLRLLPGADGRARIPDGNLFPRDGSAGLPEIYAMGCRNPWRIAVDARTGWLYWGDVGPDASEDGLRGPRGYDEINQARAAGNFGWPLLIADNQAYSEYDYATRGAGVRFDAARPVNPSPLAGGPLELPPAQPAWIWYPYADSARFPELGSGGRTACAGAVFHFDAALGTDVQLPAHYDGCLFAFEWSRHWIAAVHLAPDGSPGAIERLLPNQELRRPVDLCFGPEGALYVLEYGTSWGANADARLVRIAYHAGNRPPIACARASRTAAALPFELELESAGTRDPDGDELALEWRLAGAAAPFARGAHARLRLDAPGVHSVELRATDPAGASASAFVSLVAGNEPPRLHFESPRAGAFFEWGQPLEFRLRVEDDEDERDDQPESVAQRLLRSSVRAWYAARPPEDASGELGAFGGAAAPGAGGARAGLAAGERDLPLGLAQMRRSNCFQCHAIEHALVGPAYRAVAERLRSDPAARSLAEQRVAKGSSGVWGTTPMLAHPELSADEIHAMLDWVAGLGAAAAAELQHQGRAGSFVPQRAADAKSAGGVYVFDGSYTDAGAAGCGALSGAARVIVRARTVEAEGADAHAHCQWVDSANASGERYAGYIDAGGWLRFDALDLSEVSALVACVSSAGPGGTLELRADAADGELLASLRVEPNGAWEQWHELRAELHARRPLRALFVGFGGGEQKSSLFNVDWLRFDR